MTHIQRQIIDSYVKQKLSVQQIADFLNISSSGIRHVLDRNKIRRRSISDAIRYINITKFKKGEFKIKRNLNNHQQRLKLAGVMIYWGEGTKSGNSVVLSNSDPNLVKIFLKFLREICEVSNKRLRVVLHYYQYQKEDKLIKYWAKATKIPVGQFCKSFLHDKTGGSYKRVSKFGTISLRYSDKELLKIINLWIKEYAYKL